MAKHPEVFPPLMVNMAKAGEVGGFLDEVLLQIAENYEAEVKLRGKVKSAMTYPVVVFVMAILAVIGMLLFIVPVFAGMFAEPRRRQLPRAHPAARRAVSGLHEESCRAAGRRRRSSRPRGVGEASRSTPSGCAASSTRSSSGCRCSATCSRRSRWPGSPATSAR